MIEVGLAACASVAWGASDFAAGLAARRRPVLVVLGGSQLTGLILVAVILLAVGGAFPDEQAIRSAMIAGACEAVGFGALYAALARGPMGVVAPIAALGGAVPIGVAVVGGSQLGTLGAIGAIGALVAVGLVSRDAEGSAGRAAPGIGLALVSAAAFGAFFVFLDDASGEGPFVWGVAIARAVAVALVLPFLLHQWMRRTEPARRPSGQELGALATIGVLDVVANLLFAWGASRGSGPIVAVIGSTYPVATVLLAASVLGERLDRLQQLGVVLAVGAMALLAL
jgi:drug/metabolite transporter (DMT)-like permease